MEDRTRAQRRDDRPRRIRALIRDLTADGHSVSELELDGLRVTLRHGARISTESPVLDEVRPNVSVSTERNASSPRGYRDRAREELRRRMQDHEVIS